MNSQLKGEPFQGLNLNIQILVVDDYMLTRVMVQSILSGAGFAKVAQAESAEAAAAKLEENDIDLVICDWKMPGMTGVELLRCVRSQPRYRDLPFLMLTAESTHSSVKEAMAAGVSDYVIKPFSAEVLLDKVAQLLLKTKKQKTGKAPA
jgi:two-component system, chemotaxis family, chemotaxis protein CheY